MKKSILNLGKSLEKNQQKRINGGGEPSMGDCFEPGTNPPLLIGHAPCDGVSRCSTGLYPMCFAF